MKQKYWDRLESIITPDLEVIKNNLMVKEQDQYSVFGNYVLKSIDHGVEVRCLGVLKHNFSGFRSAVSWCIADKFRQFRLSEEIERLDEQQFRLNNDIIVIRGILKDLTDVDQKTIVETKLQDKRLKLDLVRNRLLKCVDRAKYWQIRGFNDEIARSRRQASNTTNRPSDRKSTW